MKDLRFLMMRAQRDALFAMPSALCAERNGTYLALIISRTDILLEYLLCTVCAWHTKTETLPRVTYVISPIKLI